MIKVQLFCSSSGLRCLTYIIIFIYIYILNCWCMGQHPTWYTSTNILQPQQHMHTRDPWRDEINGEAGNLEMVLKLKIKWSPYVFIWMHHMSKFQHFIFQGLMQRHLWWNVTNTSESEHVTERLSTCFPDVGWLDWHVPSTAGCRKLMEIETSKVSFGFWTLHIVSHVQDMELRCFRGKVDPQRVRHGHNSGYFPILKYVKPYEWWYIER